MWFTKLGNFFLVKCFFFRKQELTRKESGKPWSHLFFLPAKETPTKLNYQPKLGDGCITILYLRNECIWTVWNVNYVLNICIPKVNDFDAITKHFPDDDVMQEFTASSHQDSPMILKYRETNKKQTYLLTQFCYTIPMYETEKTFRERVENKEERKQPKRRTLKPSKDVLFTCEILRRTRLVPSRNPEPLDVALASPP